jgi:hypothetical protein
LERLELSVAVEHLERLPLQRLLTCLLMGDPGLALYVPVDHSLVWRPTY